MTESPNIWGKIDSAGRLIGAIMTALALIAVGFVGGSVNKAISRAEQSTESVRIRIEQSTENVRIQMEREKAVDIMRRDAFAIFAQYLESGLPDDNRKAAFLSALHGTYSEYFDTKPVFEFFTPEINSVKARQELRHSARRVARRQAEYIKANKGSDNETVKLTWEDGRALEDQKPKEFELHEHHGEVSFSKAPERYKHVPPLVPSEKERRDYQDVDDEQMDDVADRVTVRVTLSMLPKGEMTVLDETVNLSYMDSPYIDHLWMRHPDGSQHVLALRVEDIDKTDTGYISTLELLQLPPDLFIPGVRPAAKSVVRGTRAADPAATDETTDNGSTTKPAHE